MLPQDIKDLSLAELQEYFVRINEKPFRSRQIFEWIYQKGRESFDQMTSLPAELREKLKKDFKLSPLRVVEEKASIDGTKKFLFGLADDEKVESVVIPAYGRTTVCVSTQAGCKFGCKFCASGIGGFKRQLTSGEILGQILHAKRISGDQPLSHVVFMGTGEPLDNYEQVLKTIRILNAPEGIHLAARHITISTCGLIPQIKQLAKEGLQIELSVSLHGFDDASRCALMPVSKKYNFSDLIKACREYAGLTNRQVTFEYVLIQGITATAEAPQKLAKALKGMLAKVNLIPYNPVEEFSYVPLPYSEMVRFRDQLAQLKIPATIRTPRGKDIAAACGQLRHAYKKSH